MHLKMINFRINFLALLMYMSYNGKLTVLSSPKSSQISQKLYNSIDKNVFQSSHKISIRSTDSNEYSMSLLPTKERPELNPVLSALINEDVMKSIEAKRAIEKEELEAVKHENEIAAGKESQSEELTKDSNTKITTEASILVLTTQLPPTEDKIDVDNKLNARFVDQFIMLDAAGSDNNKKSRIQIKKGPNGQDYEYEYVYYYEDDLDDGDIKTKKADESQTESETRGKTRYTNIERSAAVSPSENSLQSSKAMGRSANVQNNNNDDVDVNDRLPINTRFPSRGKATDEHLAISNDTLENLAEKKKISVKRPSLELVDSDTFNTDEKQAKGLRNSDTETIKQTIDIEKEKEKLVTTTAANMIVSEPDSDPETDVTKNINNEDEEQTTPPMEKAALDLYAILTNENLNNDLTTTLPEDDSVTTNAPAVTKPDDDREETTISSTTTTTEETTKAATTTTKAPLLPGIRSTSITNNLAGRSRFKLRNGGKLNAGSVSTTSTTEPPTEPQKKNKNRYSRPLGGASHRSNSRTTIAPQQDASPVEEKVTASKEIRPVGSSFGRGRPRNRFSFRTPSTTAETIKDNEQSTTSTAEESLSSTTQRNLRGRLPLSLRGRTRLTTTEAPISPVVADGVNSENKISAVTDSVPRHNEVMRPSRFNANRATNNRLLFRGKHERLSTESPKQAEDSAPDGSHNDIQGESDKSETPEKTDASAVGETDTSELSAGQNKLHRLKNRPRINSLQHKIDNAAKPTHLNPAASAPRRTNPILSKRRLPFNMASTVDTPTIDKPSLDEETLVEPSENVSDASDSDKSSEEQSTTVTTQASTKQQAQGLGLLGQRRRMPLRKPGTLL